MGIRDRLRKLIRERGYKSPHDFAQKTGFPYVYLNAILNGRRLNETSLGRLASALKVPTYSLFADEALVPASQIREEQAGYGSLPGGFERIPYFPDPLALGPGSDISAIAPEEYLPFMKKYLPRGYKSDPDRIVAFPTIGISMKPTINSGSIVWIDRKDVEPKEGRVYAFWLADRNAVTIKRLIKVRKHSCIIDGDNHNEEDRRTEELQDFPMVLDCRDYEDQGEAWPIRGRVIWILNRLIEEPRKAG